MTELRDKLREKVLQKIVDKADEDFKNSNWESALHSYLSIIKQLPTEKIAVSIGLCYYNLESFYDSIIWLKKSLLGNPKNKKTIEQIIIIYNKLNQYENSALYINKLIEIEPQNIYSHFEKGRMYMNKGWYDKVIDSLSVAINLVRYDHPDNKIPRIYVDIYKFMGGAHYFLNNFNESEYFFKKALNFFNNDIECNYNLAETLFKLGNFNECVDYYKKYLSLKREDINYDYVYSQLISCFFKQEKLNKALLYINKFKSIIKTSEQLNRYNKYLGIYYYTDYQTDKA